MTRVRLDTALFNAGVLGFIKVLQNAGFSEIDSGIAGGKTYKTDGAILEFDGAELAAADIAQAYIDATIERFKSKSALYRQVENAKKLSDAPKPATDEEWKKFAEGCKKMCSAFINDRTASGLLILKAAGISNDISKNIAILSNLKGQESYQDALKSLKGIADDFTKLPVRDTLLMKDIMMTQIKPIWDGVAFLNTGKQGRAKPKTKKGEEKIDYPKVGDEGFDKYLCEIIEDNKNESLKGNKESDIKGKIGVDIKKSFDDDFVKPLQGALSPVRKTKNKTPQNKECRGCGSPSGKLDDLDFMDSVSVDTGKKTSAFWNYNVDLKVCPLCRFIYACAPIGFSNINDDFVFVNTNAGIGSLLGANDSKLSIENEDNSYRSFIVKTVMEIVIKTQEIHNIEVLIKPKDKAYRFDIIDKDFLNLFTGMGSIKNNLLWIKDAKVSSAVMKRLFLRRPLYGFLFNLLRGINEDNAQDTKKKNSKPGDEDKYLSDALRVLEIQIKREVNMKEQERETREREGERASKRMWALWHFGQKVKDVYERPGEKNEKKLEGFLHKLQNAVRTEDKDLFYDLLIRLCAGIDEPVPPSFLQGFSDNDTFKQVGLAFILGARGAKFENKDEDKENKKEIN